MFYSKIHEQILQIFQGDTMRATSDSFLIDRQARELSRHTPVLQRVSAYPCLSWKHKQPDRKAVYVLIR
jgi:hypothetical protein